ncbi:hypothetical protein niasHT_026566 [Heterodera trifolii]|uniref:Uncharacterized protein n=1 Tax=Heterodera trifolii TaxID=157864 RepID=A0ABD2KSG2_9BILA
MDTIFPNVLPPARLSDQQKRTVFIFTFVKCAAEFAHFRVINKSTADETYHNFNVFRGGINASFVGFLFYDQSLGHRIAKKVEEFCAQNKENGILIKQFMQLFFSFALRILLSVVSVTN